MIATKQREMKIREIKIGKRYRKELGDVEGLARSIEDLGLLHPVVVSEKGTLIAGRRRIEAFRRLNREEIPAHIINIAKIARGEHDENFYREDFRLSEAVAIKKAIEPEEKHRAKERQGTRTDLQPSAKLAGGEARDKVAKATGVARTSLARAEEIVDAAEAEPEKYTPLVEEMDRTGRVNGVYKKLKTQRQVEKIEAEPPPLPEGPFRVIVIDPPWKYHKRNTDPSHRANLPYPPMSLDEIKSLSIGEMACEDSILWLWTTNAHILEAFGIVEAWGFQYKTLLTWVKNKIGMGDWLRGQTEHCLMAVRGKPTVRLTNQSTCISGKAREHSRKPDEFYAFVEALCPGSKVELYARQERDGWTSHGSETGLFSPDR